MTDEEIISKHMSELAKKSNASRTPEQRKAAALKGAETKRRIREGNR